MSNLKFESRIASVADTLKAHKEGSTIPKEVELFVEANGIVNAKAFNQVYTNPEPSQEYLDEQDPKKKELLKPIPELVSCSIAGHFETFKNDLRIFECEIL